MRARDDLKLHVSDDLVLGPDFIVATDGIFASKGMGKTHLAQVMAEEMLERKQVVVAIDPTDAWWGLRSSADGRSDGYPIVVIGGDHGDLKLEPDAGGKLAETIVSERFSCVLCTDGLSDTAEIKFVREFLDTLYRKNREPIHLFIDEADVFAPQKPFEVEDSRCIRAMSHVVRRGRKKGIGTTLITQRPAELNASVRSMVEMLFVLGMSHNLDIDAVQKWLRLRKKKVGNNAAFALQEEMIESLDSLPKGDAWVWAPRLKLHKHFRARAKRTFDSGATPKPGQHARTAKRLAPIDIARLGQLITETVQRQKDNDPKELKLQVAALRRELENVGKGQDRAERNEKDLHTENVELRIELAALKEKKSKKAVEKPILKDAQIKRIEKLIDVGSTATLAHASRIADRVGELTKQAAERIWESNSKLEDALGDLRTVLSRVLEDRAEQIVDKALPGAWRGPSRQLRAAEVTQAPSPKVQPRGTTNSDHGLKPAHLRLLSAIAWWESVGVQMPDLGGVAFVAGTSTKSSAFDNNRSRLRAAGYIDYPSTGRVQLTTAGHDLAPPPILPPTNEALHDAILQKVTPAHGRMLKVLIEAHPSEMSLEEFAKQAGTSTTSSAFDNNRSWLRARGLAEYPRTGFVRATALLFPEDAA